MIFDTNIFTLVPWCTVLTILDINLPKHCLLNSKIRKSNVFRHSWCNQYNNSTQ